MASKRSNGTSSTSRGASVKLDAVTDEGDKKRVAKAARQGLATPCSAPTRVMAQSLGRKSPSGFAPRGRRAALRGEGGLQEGEQRGEGRGACCARAAKEYPQDERFALELGRLLLSEKRRRRRRARAVGHRQEVEAVQGSEAAARQGRRGWRRRARGGARQLEADREGRREAGGRRGPDRGGLGRAGFATTRGRDLRRSAGPSGLLGRAPARARTSRASTARAAAVRANAHFRFRYFNAQARLRAARRLRGQRAGRARAGTRPEQERARRHARGGPTDVILYSADEFKMHHGTGMGPSRWAGFYSENAIRMNDSAEINARQPGGGSCTSTRMRCSTRGLALSRRARAALAQRGARDLGRVALPGLRRAAAARAEGDSGARRCRSGCLRCARWRRRRW